MLELFGADTFMPTIKCLVYCRQILLVLFLKGEAVMSRSCVPISLSGSSNNEQKYTFRTGQTDGEMIDILAAVFNTLKFAKVDCTTSFLFFKKHLRAN